ncbi:transglycosylase SLT domain-containing protein [uncultured Bartonella sp.]|uniref:lytic transglycosylase domain-containing protein n=1 Tax=uncultured Bartonella sp. TaxID=104108 RepID=UPI0026218D29|nr:transglycosylase SLT domain-containing protein [uncultured Bartonella sp.]
MRKYSTGFLTKTILPLALGTGLLTPTFAAELSSPVKNAPIPLARPLAAAPKTTTPSKSDNTIVTNAIARPGNIIATNSLKSGLDALYGKQVSTAITIRNSLPKNSLDRHILTWAIGVSGISGIPSSEIFNAAAELNNWPGMTVMRRNSERALTNEVNSPQAIINGFGNHIPVTAQGMAALGGALVETGQSARARQIVAPWWYKAKLNGQEEQLVLKKVGTALLPADHLQRMRVMLYANRISSAQRVASLANAQSLFNGVASVANNESNARQKLAAVDKNLRKDSLYLFAQIQYLRRSGQYDEATKLMFKAPKDAASLVDPDAWWIERRVLSREMLDLNKPKIAYQLAAAHSAENPTLAADAEFHAGWYALRFIGDQKAAMQHFSRIVQISSRPLTASRGYYWMGRTAETSGNRNSAIEYFRRAAHYGTTYYGQLAAARLGEQKLEIPYPKPTGDDRQRFETREPVMAIKRLEALGYSDRAGVLYRELGDELNSAGELAMLAVMAERKGDYYTSLKIGKSAVIRGMDVGSLSHPVGAIPETANISASGKALAYAIARQESEFNPNAVSGAGARGMLQLLPATAKAVAIKNAIAWQPEKLSSDAGYNATLGAHFLGEQLNRFNGSYILTFIGYNAGARRANEWIERYGDPRGQSVDWVVDWVERIPYSETRDYVMRVMENYQVYKARLTGVADINVDLAAGRRN